MRFLLGRRTVPAFSVAELKLQLVNNRPVTANASETSPAATDEQSIARNTDNWVCTWVDKDHRIIHSDSKCIAYRAITDSGQFIWMVETPGRKYAYHADAMTPGDAFKQAENARQARRNIAKRWREVKQLRRQVVLGSVQLTASLEDARNAGLCELGIQGFLDKIGYGGATHVSGRILMLISYFDRQVAYPVFNAHLRSQQDSRTLDAVSNVSVS